MSQYNNDDSDDQNKSQWTYDKRRMYQYLNVVHWERKHRCESDDECFFACFLKRCHCDDFPRKQITMWIEKIAVGNIFLCVQSGRFEFCSFSRFNRDTNKMIWLIDSMDEDLIVYFGALFCRRHILFSWRIKKRDTSKFERWIVNFQAEVLLANK